MLAHADAVLQCSRRWLWRRMRAAARSRSTSLTYTTPTATSSRGRCVLILPCVSSYSYMCVLILICVSSYSYRCVLICSYLCVLILVYMCPHTAKHYYILQHTPVRLYFVPGYVTVSSYSCICVLNTPIYMCPHIYIRLLLQGYVIVPDPNLTIAAVC